MCWYIRIKTDEGIGRKHLFQFLRESTEARCCEEKFGMTEGKCEENS